MHPHVKTLQIATLLAITISTSLSLQADTFEAHCRDRGQEMVSGAGGECSGPIPDLLETALGKLGHTVAWKAVPWVRTIRNAPEGSPDILLRHSMNSERRDFLLPIVYGYETRKLYFYVSPKKTNIKVESANDLKNYKIGVIRDSFYAPEFDGMSNLKKHIVMDLEQKIKMLETGRIELAAIKSTILNKDVEEKLANMNSKPANYSEEFFNGRYFSIPKKSPMAKHYNAVSKVIYDMRKAGEIDQIFDKHKVGAPAQDYSHEDSKSQEKLAGM